MNDFVFWTANNNNLFLGFGIILFYAIIYFTVSLVHKSVKKIKKVDDKEASNYSVPTGLVTTVILICSIFYSGTHFGTAILDNGITVQIRPGNKFNISYIKKESYEQGYDLNGQIVYGYNTINEQRIIICQANSIVINYKECWKSIQGKTSQELISMSKPLDKKLSLNN